MGVIIGVAPLVVEPVPVADIFATGILKPEIADNTVRITCYAERLGLDGRAEHIVVSRVVFTRADYFRALHMAAKALGIDIIGFKLG